MEAPVVPTLHHQTIPMTARIHERLEGLAYSNNKRNKKIKQARQLVGDFHSGLLRELKSNKERRPFLAIVAGFPRKLLEEAFGIKVPKREYTNLKIHSRFPGPGKPVQATKIFRNRIKDEVIVALLDCLESGNNPLIKAFAGKRHPTTNPLGYMNVKTLALVVRKTGVPLVGICGRTIESLRSACQEINAARQNPKENIPSFKVSFF
jgi:hypothetical protein